MRSRAVARIGWRLCRPGFYPWLNAFVHFVLGSSPLTELASNEYRIDSEMFECIEILECDCETRAETNYCGVFTGHLLGIPAFDGRWRCGRTGETHRCEEGVAHIRGPRSADFSDELPQMS